MIHFVIYAIESLETCASPADIWPLLADLRSYTRWGPWDEVCLEKGAKHTDIGAIRKKRSGLIVVREKILRVETEALLQYRVVSGLPVRDYVAFTLIEPLADGCRLTWGARFTAVIPGTARFLEKKFSRRFKELLFRLALAAESASGASESQRMIAQPARH